MTGTRSNWTASAMRQMTGALVLSAAALCATLAGCGTGLSAQKKAEKATFHYKLANNYFHDHKVVPALHELKTCLEFDKDYPDAHFLRGFILFGRKEYAEAEDHFRHALKMRPAFHAARSNLGALLLATRRWAEAVDMLQPLVDATLYGTPWIVHNNLGFAWGKLGRVHKAEKHYKLALFHNQKFCLGYNNLGALYKERGHAEEALEFLNRAATQCARYSEPHFHMAEILEEQGRAAEARNQFMQCYKDAPDSAFGRRCRRRM